MMVTSTFMAELEAHRTALVAERARIREEYETRLPDIENDLVAVEQLLRRRPGPAVDTAPEAPEVGQGAQAPLGAVQSTSIAARDALAAPDPAEAITDVAASAEAEHSTPIRPQRGPNWRRVLAGLRQEPAAVKIAEKIAERAGGTVSVADVALVFMEVGLTRATGKLAKGQASKTLSESPRFERVGKGTYRLIAESATEMSDE